jgi:two-component system cell cycle response regulator
MTARVLVVDDILANVRLLEARLTADYYEVLTALSGAQALDILARERVDIVLLDVMMPEMDGFEVCRRMKASRELHDIPVVMVTALDQPADKVHGLDAGADDFLTKPVDDIALVTRVRNLARLKMLNDEMSMRASSGERVGLVGGLAGALGPAPAEDVRGRILVVDDHPRSVQRIVETLGKAHEVSFCSDPPDALMQLVDRRIDLLVVSVGLANADGLRLCSQVRSLERTRHLPIIILVEPGEEARLMRGLDMGVNDYLMRPIDRNEMLARVRTQIRRKRHSDFLRHRLEESVELAITDPLTGLHNRRYMEAHLRSLMDQAQATGRALSLLLVDIDHFKSVNDTYGHDAGDAVLREFAARFRRNTRGIDLACRLGGEEFVSIMPDTEMSRACQVGERLRSCVAADSFHIGAGTQIQVTASVGVASLERPTDTPEALIKRADNALYAAKRQGRNRVVGDAA